MSSFKFVPSFALALGLLLCSALHSGAQSKVEIELAIENIAPDGVVFQQIPAGAAKAILQNGDHAPLRATFRSREYSGEAQLVPGPFFGRDNANAMLLLRAPGQKNLRGTLHVERDGAAKNQTISGAHTVQTAAAQWTFSPQASGIFPAHVQLAGSGKTLSAYSWGDRVFDRALGSFTLSGDKSATLSVVSDGPVATVLRGAARYHQSAAKPTPGRAAAIYDWYFFKASPHVFVDAYQFADAPFAWSQSVFMEWIFKEKYFDARRSSEVSTPAALTGDKKSVTGQKWSALVSDSGAVAMIGGPSTIHDGLGSYGNYIRSANPSPTLGWNGRARRLTGWFWAASIDAGNLPAALDAATELAVSRFVETDVRVASARIATSTPAADAPALQAWKQALLQREFSLGRLAPDGTGTLRLPAAWRFAQSGDLGLAFDVTQSGARLISVYDLQNQRELAADEMPPLFELEFTDIARKTAIALDARGGWQNVEFRRINNSFELHFQQRDSQNAPIGVVVSAHANERDSAWEWKIRVGNSGSAWSVAHVLFPQVSLKRQSRDTRTFVPRQSGVVVAQPFHENFQFDRVYPTGGATMQYMAVYPHGADAAGLYVARHDPTAARKRLLLDTDNIALASKLSFAQTPENPETPGNDFNLSGSGVWKLLRGDWFDAAKYYKQWAQREASWWPQLGEEGRADTPLWYRRLNVWSTRGGDVQAASGVLRRFRDFLELPVGNHWYYWHQIPFDNDYPHYFPAVPGFRDAVATLQKDGVRVMPYINGRLWDTRDKGAEDFEYSSRALPWTTKVREGEELKPFTSTFRSKESDGSMASLAVMCPYTEFWQDKVAEIVACLTDEEKVGGVYLDQIGASPPILCLDATHGHPLGGGSWWVEGYNRMLSRIQQNLPDGAILTTEDNAEPYIKNFDGVLTWQWINEGQVPAFSAVYGGAVQMFGRSFAAVEGDDPNLAARMKMGQQLVYGEQLGWISPDFFFGRLDDASREYFKRLAHTRDRIGSYLYAGEMLRAPKLEGDNPPLTANWRAGGPVTLDSVQSGAWEKRGANKLALIFTNLNSQPQTLKYQFDAAEYGVPANFKITSWSSAKPAAAETIRLENNATTLNLPGLSTLVLEISW